jgi:hypothetical protein
MQSSRAQSLEEMIHNAQSILNQMYDEVTARSSSSPDAPRRPSRQEGYQAPPPPGQSLNAPVFALPQLPKTTIDGSGPTNVPPVYQLAPTLNDGYPDLETQDFHPLAPQSHTSVDSGYGTQQQRDFFCRCDSFYALSNDSSHSSHSGSNSFIDPRGLSSGSSTSAESLTSTTGNLQGKMNLHRKHGLRC